MFMTPLFSGWTLRAMMRLQGDQDVRRGKQRIDACLRTGCVRALAFDRDPKAVHSSAERPRARREMADRQAGLVVQGEHFLDVPAGHQPVIAHGFCASAAFFGGLKDQHRRAVEIARLSQTLCGAQQHRRVSIVPARMHPAGNLRRVGKACRFFDWKSIHVGAQSDYLAGGLASSRDDTDDTADADALGDTVAAKSSQLVGNE